MATQKNPSPVRIQRFLKLHLTQPWKEVVRAALPEFALPTPALAEAMLRSYVAVRIVVRDGRAVVLRQAQDPIALADSNFGYFVDPATGVLKLNDERLKKEAAAKAREKKIAQEAAAKRRDVQPGLQAHLQNSRWFLVQLAPLEDKAFDMLLKRTVSLSVDGGELARLYGTSGVYGVQARELSFRETQQLQLASK